MITCKISTHYGFENSNRAHDSIRRPFLNWQLMFLAFICLPMSIGCTNVVGFAEDFGGSEFTEQERAKKAKAKQEKESEKEDMATELKTATFGNGCYWCTEAVFQRVKGVKSVVSGFSGGHVEDPTYYQVCRGKTGHAEVLQITYDPEIVSFEKLLEVFWKTHDPTTLNRQGNDVGPQYRSAVFYHDKEQKELAEKYKKRLDKSGAFRNPIVTEITEFDKFYTAPEEHQNYYNENKNSNPYCGMIQMKLEKFRDAFSDVIDKKKDVIK